MAQKKKKGPPPRTKEPAKKKMSVSQIIFSIFAILMVLLMIGPNILSLFQ